MGDSRDTLLNLFPGAFDFVALDPVTAISDEPKHALHVKLLKPITVTRQPWEDPFIDPGPPHREHYRIVQDDEALEFDAIVSLQPDGSLQLSPLG